MATKRKAKAAQWVKVDGEWFKVKVTVCKTVKWTYGLKSNGWEPKAKCNMAERGQFHVTNPKGVLKAEAI